MQYIITFLEGVISFISPCMLPMLPVYISYFSGGADKKQRTFARALGFVIGFTLVFTAMGLFAGTMSLLMTKYQKIVNIVCGLVVINFGIRYLGLLPMPDFKGMSTSKRIDGFFSAMLFGMIYSISLTPCVGVFLGSALMLASSAGSSLKGAMLLMTYSLGLGVPFLLSAIMLEKLNSTFMVIKKHYGKVNTVCGVFLVFIGVMMMLGWMGSVMAWFM